MKRLKNFADYYIVSIKLTFYNDFGGIIYNLQNKNIIKQCFGAEKEVNKCVISVIKKVGMRN